MRALYEIGLHLLALASFPWALKAWCKGKYRKSLKPRLGIDFPPIEKGSRPLIWVHAVSLGETRAVIPLVKQLKAMPGNPQIVLSTLTETGFTEGAKCPADHHVYLPFDFSYIIGPIIRRTKPDLVILTETDFWFNFQRAAKEAGAKIALVNGKLSERSLSRFVRFKPFADALFSTIDLFCLQGRGYWERFSRLGIPGEKLIVTGNLKLSTPADPLPSGDLAALRSHLGIEGLVLTAGSTHEGEERLLLEAACVLWKSHPALKVLLVPRHPERFDRVAGLLEEMEIPFSRWSLKDHSPDKKVILVDAMGELRKCYQLSTVAFVGGTFEPKVGGHNILEPAFYSVPVIFGPFIHSQPDFFELAKSYGSGVQVTEQTLLSTLSELLSSPEAAREMGACGLRLTEQSRGALEKTLQALQSCLP